MKTATDDGDDIAARVLSRDNMAKFTNNRLSRIEIKGYRSIKDLDLTLENLNVLIGANGSGKSNFISFFKLLNFSLDSPEGLGEFVGRNGGANVLTHYGTDVTPTIEAQLHFSTKSGANRYSVELGFVVGNRLFFKNETIRFDRNDISTKAPLIPLGGGGSSSRLLQIEKDDPQYGKYNQTVSVIRNIMRNWRFFQFHNTSENSFVRSPGDARDDNYLRSDGRNLATVLASLQDNKTSVFNEIVSVVKQIAPYISDITVEDVFLSKSKAIKWKENGHPDYVFDASQMSDGTLRALALVTLLLLPEKPSLICIDEPELGLHPEAIVIVADLIKTAQKDVQMIISTQSPKFVDCFESNDIIVADRIAAGTQLTRLDYEKYKVWLDEYTISETWDTNVFGGCL
jgi:predicted ATPase